MNILGTFKMSLWFLVSKREARTRVSLNVLGTEAVRKDMDFDKISETMIHNISEWKIRIYAVERQNSGRRFFLGVKQ